eukprot:1248803-Rhodomonas_salina.2
MVAILLLLPLPGVDQQRVCVPNLYNGEDSRVQRREFPCIRLRTSQDLPIGALSAERYYSSTTTSTSKAIRETSSTPWFYCAHGHRSKLHPWLDQYKTDCFSNSPPSAMTTTCTTMHSQSPARMLSALRHSIALLQSPAGMKIDWNASRDFSRSRSIEFVDSGGSFHLCAPIIETSAKVSAPSTLMTRLPSNR